MLSDAADKLPPPIASLFSKIYLKKNPEQWKVAKKNYLLAGSEPLNEEADPHIIKLAIGAQMYDKMKLKITWGIIESQIQGKYQTEVKTLIHYIRRCPSGTVLPANPLHIYGVISYNIRF